jgi:hypothetical protein
MHIFGSSSASAFFAAAITHEYQTSDSSVLKLTF